MSTVSHLYSSYKETVCIVYGTHWLEFLKEKVRRGQSACSDEQGVVLSLTHIFQFFLWLLRRPILRSSLRSSSAFTKWSFVTNEGSSWRSFARYRTGRNECGESIHWRIRRWALLETDHLSRNSGLTTPVSIFIWNFLPPEISVYCSNEAYIFGGMKCLYIYSASLIVARFIIDSSYDIFFYGK